MRLYVEETVNLCYDRERINGKVRKHMKIYFAPMEGITGYVYRNAHHRYYDGVDQYFTPFISPGQTKKLTPRELNDVMPEHNKDICVVPQILTNHAEDFIWAAGKLKEMGYKEVNLNLGCPSGTVVSKNRGSGFLAFPVRLEAFLDTVSRELARMEMKFSIKTRIGKTDEEEFGDLLRIFNRYELEKLIIHPRLQTDYYRNHPNMEVFRMAVRESRNPVCYNGDLFSPEDIRIFQEQFPEVEALMLGRGLLTNPALHRMISGDALDEKADGRQLKAFHDAVLEGYRQVIPGDKNVLFKMKELWFYLSDAFENSKKQVKKIKKTQHMADYQMEAEQIFSSCVLAKPPVFRGGK